MIAVQQQINVLKAQIAYLESRLFILETDAHEETHEARHVQCTAKPQQRTKTVNIREKSSYEDPYMYPSPTSVV